MQHFVEISPGELIDRTTILEIKLENIRDAAKRANVAREYAALGAALRQRLAENGELAPLRQRLREVNGELWRIENEIRVFERLGRFDGEFVALARSVYRTNDLRAELKRQINLLAGSPIVEEKSYAAY